MNHLERRFNKDLFIKNAYALPSLRENYCRMMHLPTKYVTVVDG